MVGQALRNVYDDEGYRVPCIGFCQWGFMRDKDKLVNKNKIVNYNAVDQIADDGSCVSLEPNHTHFIIVDDGTEGQEYGEYKLYNEVKKAMKKLWSGAFSHIQLCVCVRACVYVYYMYTVWTIAVCAYIKELYFCLTVSQPVGRLVRLPQTASSLCPSSHLSFRDLLPPLSLHIHPSVCL